MERAGSIRVEGGGSRWLRLGWLGALGLALLYAPFGRSEEPAKFSEYQVKGAFLVKFAMFIEWPAGTFPDPRSPIRLGIFGDDPFGPEFEKALQREVANGRPFVLQRCQKPQEAAECHILFITTSEAGHLAKILEAVRGKPVLTVGDQEGFAEHSGMINFFKEGGKVRFEVNAAAIQEARLKVSAKLQQVSRPVAAKADGGGVTR